jgi:hypothetical protein
MTGMIATLGISPEDGQALLLAEGDRLATKLIQHFPVSTGDLTRAYVVGRSIAVNLVQAFFPTAELVTRQLARPLTLYLSADERGRAEVLAVNSDGEAEERLPVDELLEQALYQNGRLIPQARTELAEAMQAASERAMTLALIRLLRLKCVLDATGAVLGRYARRS